MASLNEPTPRHRFIFRSNESLVKLLFVRLCGRIQSMPGVGPFGLSFGGLFTRVSTGSLSSELITISVDLRLLSVPALERLVYFLTGVERFEIAREERLFQWACYLSDTRRFVFILPRRRIPELAVAANAILDG